jgi:hypothetical protein
MGAGVIDGVKTPAHIKKGYPPATDLKHLALARLNVFGFGYLHKGCHNLPPERFLEHRPRPETLILASACNLAS